VYLSLGYFIAETHGAEAASSVHRFARSGMTLSDRAKSPELVIDGQSFAANALTFVDGSDRRHVWYWYCVAGRYTGNPYLAKLLQLRTKLLGGPRTATIVSVGMDEVSGAEETPVAVLTNFVSRLRVIDTN
jgi:EpsI family protein